jgi:hypothetical protein
MEMLRTAWRESPWSRVSFGTEWVYDPAGDVLLATGFHKHDPDEEITAMFREMLESALKRWQRIRSHERGSTAEEAEWAAVAREIEADKKRLRACWLDLDLLTRETVKAFGANTELFNRRLTGPFQYPDPDVRRRGAVLMGRWAAGLSEEDRVSQKTTQIGKAVAGLLDDEAQVVRQAAAVAVHQFQGRAISDADDPELVAAARTLWDERAN